MCPKRSEEVQEYKRKMCLNDSFHSIKPTKHDNGNIQRSNKEEPNAETIRSMLGSQTYWDATYADELTSFRQHGDAGEVWFRIDILQMVVFPGQKDYVLMKN